MKAKRMLSLLLTAALMLSMMTPAFAAAAQTELPLASQTQMEETNEAVSIRLQATGKLVYGSPFELSVVTRPADVQYIGVVLGVKGEAKGYVTLVLSDKLRTLLKMIPLPRKMSKTPDQVEEFNVYAYVKQLIDGNDVSVLLGVADEVVKVMDTLKFYIPTLKDMSMGLKLSLELIRRYLPEGAFSRIYLDEQPVDSGRYVAGAVALESGDLNTAGVAMFKIKPKTEGVRLYWAEDLPAATKAQPFPSSHFRKSSTRDRLTTISNSGRGRAVIFSRLPRYFTMLTIASMAMMQLRDMRKNRPGSSSSERTSSD